MRGGGGGDARRRTLPRRHLSRGDGAPGENAKRRDARRRDESPRRRRAIARRRESLRRRHRRGAPSPRFYAKTIERCDTRASTPVRLIRGGKRPTRRGRRRGRRRRGGGATRLGRGRRARVCIADADVAQRFEAPSAFPTAVAAARDETFPAAIALARSPLTRGRASAPLRLFFAAVVASGCEPARKRARRSWTRGPVMAPTPVLRTPAPRSRPPPPPRRCSGSASRRCARKRTRRGKMSRPAWRRRSRRTRAGRTRGARLSRFARWANSDASRRARSTTPRRRRWRRPFARRSTPRAKRFDPRRRSRSAARRRGRRARDFYPPSSTASSAATKNDATRSSSPARMIEAVGVGRAWEEAPPTRETRMTRAPPRGTSRRFRRRRRKPSRTRFCPARLTREEAARRRRRVSADSPRDIPRGLVARLAELADPTVDAGKDPNARITAVTAGKYLATTLARGDDARRRRRRRRRSRPSRVNNRRDADRGVRRAAAQTLSAAAHARPASVLPILPDVLPILLESAAVDESLVRVVDLGRSRSPSTTD